MSDELHRRGHTPTSLLDAAPAHPMRDTAFILRFLRRNGEPNPRPVIDMAKAGKIRLVDPDQPVHRWTISSDEIRRYLTKGPRRPELEAHGEKPTRRAS